jgi:hypothetical protein
MRGPDDSAPVLRRHGRLRAVHRTACAERELEGGVDSAAEKDSPGRGEWRPPDSELRLAEDAAPPGGRSLITGIGFEIWAVPKDFWIASV